MAIEAERKEKVSVVQPRERLAVAVLIMLIGLIVIWDGSRQVADSAYYPWAVGGALVLLSIASLVSAEKKARPTDEAPLGKGFLGLLALGVFIAFAGTVGFLTSSLVFVPVLAWLGGERRWAYVLTGTVVFVIAAYVVFNLIFSHPFPAELIFGGDYA